MEQLESGLDRLYNTKKNLEYLLDIGEDGEIDQGEIEEINNFKREFIDAMEDDLNTADAIASLFDISKYTNTNFNEKTSKFMVQYTYDTFMELGQVLGLLYREEEILEEEILELIEKRTQARKEKNYQLADKIREDLKSKGIILEDTSEGIKWKRL